MEVFSLDGSSDVRFAVLPLTSWQLCLCFTLVLACPKIFFTLVNSLLLWSVDKEGMYAVFFLVFVWFMKPWILHMTYIPSCVFNVSFSCNHLSSSWILWENANHFIFDIKSSCIHISIYQILISSAADSIVHVQISHVTVAKGKKKDCKLQEKINSGKAVNTFEESGSLLKECLVEGTVYSWKMCKYHHSSLFCFNSVIFQTVQIVKEISVWKNF